MKCPKCSYLGFEHSDRCRNCGYDFSLAPIAELELDMRVGTQQPRPIADLTFVDAAAAPGPAVALADAGPDLDRLFGEPSPTMAPPSQELPLFGPPIPDDDRPLITKVSPPRTPIAVRRATPQVPRLRADQPRVQSFDLAADAATEPASPGAPATAQFQPPERPILRESAAHGDAPVADGVEAPVASRFVAVVIDAIILALIDVAVIYFTMRICGVTLAELGMLPKGPLLAFLIVQNGGYLVTFTAGGQTLGKMAAGIRVIGADPDESLDLGRAFLRELMWLVLAVPAGLGFCTALFGRDHRGLHDHFAGTRVIRATA